MSQFLGIEIGGTKLQIGVGSAEGTLTRIWRDTVNVEEGGEGIRRRLIEVVPTLLNDSIQAIGIGYGGPVDDATGRTITSHQISGWDDFPLVEWSQEHFRRPTVIGNDADVAGLGEARFGAGRGFSPLFYITIGSGIGGALILDGKIYRGVGRGAAEIGHLRMKQESEPTILEHLASGWAIGRAAKMNAHVVAESARQGDPEAFKVLDQAWTHLAEGICDVIALLCPRRIVIGGGVSLMGEDLLFGHLRRLVAERVFRPLADCYDIVPAALGEEVVLHGALALATLEE